MPATVEAAAVTDSYRAWLVGLVAALRRRAAADMADMRFDDVDGWLREWLAVFAPIVDAATVAAAARSAAYLTAYFRASGVDDVVFPQAAVDTSGIAAALDGARVGALWRLSRGDGRMAARVTASAVLDRVTATTVYDAARSAQHTAMAGEPRVAGWRRVTSTRPCGACLAISGRVERREDVVDRHDRCSCTGEPVIRGVAERVTRPTGQQRVDEMPDGELVALLGEQKAAVVRSRGVSVLVDHVDGQLVETPLQAITTG